MMWPLHIWKYLRDTWQYRHEPENLRLIADMYWRILLALAVLVLLSLIGYAGLKFYEVFGKTEENPLLTSGGGIFLNPKDLESVLEGFAKKKKDFEFFKRNTPILADPSK